MIRRSKYITKVSVYNTGCVIDHVGGKKTTCLKRSYPVGNECEICERKYRDKMMFFTYIKRSNFTKEAIILDFKVEE